MSYNVSTGKGNFVIGPVRLDVPPETIQFSRYENQQFLQFLRHEHSIKLPSGRSAVRVDIAFRLLCGDNFQDLITLQRLIAMTRVCPFVPVQNEYLAQHLQMESISAQFGLTDSIPMAIFGMAINAGGDSPEVIECTMSLLFWNPLPFLGGEAMAWTNQGRDSILKDIDKWIASNITGKVKAPDQADIFRLTWYTIKMYSELLNTFPDVQVSQPQAEVKCDIRDTSDPNRPIDPNNPQAVPETSQYIPDLEEKLRAVAGDLQTMAKGQVTQAPTVQSLPSTKFDPRMKQWEAQIRASASRSGVDPEVLMRLINQESRGNPNAVSKAGARGLAQFMPATAAQYGVDTSNPYSSIDGAARYLADLQKQFKGDVVKAVAAYNAGPGNVRKYGGVPPFDETINYVNKILGTTVPNQKYSSPIVAQVDPVEIAIRDYYAGQPGKAQQVIVQNWHNGLLPNDPGLRQFLANNFGISSRPTKPGEPHQEGAAYLTSFGKQLARTPAPFVDPDVVKKLNKKGWQRTSEDIRPQEPLFFDRDHPNVLEMSTVGPITARPKNVITALSLSFQNRFALMPISGWPYPSIQHMGAFDSDMRISLAILGDENFPMLKELNRMLHEMDVRSIQYRSSVFNGRDCFAITRVDVDNRILNSIGIKNAILTDVQAMRDPESPELVRVEFGLTENGMVDEELLGHYNYSDELWRNKLFDWLTSKAWATEDDASTYKNGDVSLVDFAKKLLAMWDTQDAAFKKNSQTIEETINSSLTPDSVNLLKSIRTAGTTPMVKYETVRTGSFLMDDALTTKVISADPAQPDIKFQHINMKIGPPGVSEPLLYREFMLKLDQKYCETPVLFAVPSDPDTLLNRSIVEWAAIVWRQLYGSIGTGDPEYPNRLVQRYLDGPYGVACLQAIQALKNVPKTNTSQGDEEQSLSPDFTKGILNWLKVWNLAHEDWYKNQVIIGILTALARDFPDYFDKLVNEVNKENDRKSGCYRDLGLADDLHSNPYEWVDSVFARQLQNGLEELSDRSSKYINAVLAYSRDVTPKYEGGVYSYNDWQKTLAQTRKDHSDLQIKAEDASQRSKAGVANYYQLAPQQIEEALKAVKHISPVQFTIRRAFPAFKLYFVDEQNGGLIKTFDEFYSYNAVLDWNLIEQTNQGSTLVLTLSNIFNHLDALVLNEDINMEGMGRLGLAGLQAGKQAFIQNRNNSGVSVEVGTDGRSQPIQNIALRPGTKIVLKVGYNNDPAKLETIFAGQVTEVNVGDTMTVVCQGWESELMSLWAPEVEYPIGGWWGLRSIFSAIEEDPTGTGGTTMMMKAIMRHPQVKHFGHWQIGPVNPFDLYSWSYTENKLQIRQAVTDTPGGDRSTTNIRPSQTPFFSAWGLDAEIEKVEVEGRTLWEIAQELRLRHPNDILMVRPYGNGDATLYFGPPWGDYTATDFVDERGLYSSNALNSMRLEAFSRLIDREAKIFMNRVTYKEGDPFLKGMDNDVGPIETFVRTKVSRLWTSDTGTTFSPIEISKFLQDPRILSLLFRSSARGEDYYRERYDKLSNQTEGGALRAFESVTDFIKNVATSIVAINTAANRTNRDHVYELGILKAGCSTDVKQLFFDAFNDLRYVGVRDPSDKSRLDILKGHEPIHANMLNYALRLIDQEIIRILEELKDTAKPGSDAEKALRVLPFLVKPVRKWHIITSKHHIISNNIQINSDFANRIKFGDMVVPFDPGLTDPRTRDISQAYKTGSAVDGYVASNILAGELRKMYRGEIIVTGNPEIRPHDIILVLDERSQIFGIVEAEKVVNSMSIEYGYITTIMPALVVEVGDMTVAHAYQAFYSGLVKDLRFMNESGGDVGEATAKAIQFAVAPTSHRDIDELARQVDAIQPGSTSGPDSDGHTIGRVGVEAGGLVAAYGAVGAATAGIGAFTAGGGLIAAAGAAAGPLGILIGGGALLVGGYMYCSWLNNSIYDMVRTHPLSITPLVKRGVPWVAGIDGTAGRTVVGQHGVNLFRGLQDYGKMLDVVAQVQTLVSKAETTPDTIVTPKSDLVP